MVSLELKSGDGDSVSNSIELFSTRSDLATIEAPPPMKILLTALAFGALTFAQQDDAKRGQQQYAKSCAFCHGAGGGRRRTEGPSLIRNGALLAPR